MTGRRGGRWWTAGIAVTGTAVLGLGAFWLSFTALSDLARLAGIAPEQSWAWAAIVDGVIVTSTVAAVALDGTGWRTTWFPWALLAASAGVSVLANVLHAVVASEGQIAPVLAGAIAAIPPLVLLAMTHLTVVVVRHARTPQTDQAKEEAAAPPVETPRIAEPPSPAPRRIPVRKGPESAARFDAERLRNEEGLSNRQIALRLGVHPSTIGRWLPPTTAQPDGADAPDEHAVPEEREGAFP